MFHGIGKPKFYKKSKSLLKVLKTRLDQIKKKKNAVQKFMKSDIADLLKNNLDMNAYGRAEGLLVEQNILCCYNIIEQCIECVSGQVSVMQKQKECPSECIEAVPTLMYAAARFADLPELRELRALYTEKYGNSLDSYVNKEFVDRLKLTPPTKEIKLQLLQDVAREFNMEWDSKALQQKLFTPPPPAQHNPKHGSFYDMEDDESKKPKRRDKEYNLPSSSEDDVGVNLRRDDSTSQDSRHTTSSSVESVSEDEPDSKKPFYYRFIPPPYFKNNPAPKKSSLEEPTNAEKNDHQDPPVGAADDKKPRSMRKNKLKPPPGREVIVDDETKAKQERQRAKALKALKDDGEDSDEDKRLDDLLMHYSKKKAPQDSSSRVKENSKPPPGHTRGNSELQLPPGRTSSVPTEMRILPSARETKQPFRTKSLEEDIFNRHVHPKLPDYDDLAARLAALRGL